MEYLELFMKRFRICHPYHVILFLLRLMMDFSTSSNNDFVVFEMYKRNNNQCKRNKMGTYKTDVGSFVKAYMKQKEQIKDTYGVDYNAPDDDVLQYLNCQQVYSNNNWVSTM